MLLLGIITLVMTIPLASLYLSTILIHRIAFLILLLSAVLSYNTLYVVPLSSGIGILGGLFQTTQISQMGDNNIIVIRSRHPRQRARARDLFFSRCSFSSICNSLY